ncbi:MAG TPA: Mur ligase family protein [Candidatus Limnocylindria bacterium]|nr:Mur ligase family protein [Candidatus Limnocylindria bacterium]
MPGQSPPRPGAELLELRVLDGPNRFFVRPAVKLEFSAPQPGVADSVARAAGEAVLALHAELGLPAPRLAYRSSIDGLRALVAFPWRRRTISQSVGTAASRVALGRSTVRREQSALGAMALGPLPAVPTPRIPVVAITGTNGKSTTTRLVAHVAAGAGRAVGMTNSDGIFIRGELAEAGDWTGYGGAGRILAEPGLDLAVLETARGGILLRGIGYDHNDVGVITNVSADHLGLQGIDTVEELAEVKAAVVRVTRRTGWAVLNGEDPLVWGMRRQTRAGWYAFSLDPRSPAVLQALERGGRAAVLEDGWLVLRRGGGRRARLAPVGEVPVTAAGLAGYNIANALAAAAACDAIGLGPSLIAAGLRSFALDTGANPGRLNLFVRDGVLAIVDFAHNEAGLAGLLQVCRSLVGAADGDRAAGRIRLGLGTAGDRTDAILRRLGELAGAGADEVVICEKRHYLRGRTVRGMNAILREGVRAGGYTGKVVAHPTELAALRALLRHAAPGDVAAVMAHVERAEIFAWLEREGYRPTAAREALAGRPR